MIDLALTKNDYYDISFTDGDFTLTDGLDTALILSVYCERRADASEVSTPNLQRGWWGNLFSLKQNFEQGSKLWLLYQSRNTQLTLNRAIAYAQDAFSWMVEDGLLDNVEVNGEMIAQGIKIIVTLYRSQNIVGNFAYDLWDNTKGLN
jgi:phage gp46-like protein